MMQAALFSVSEKARRRGDHYATVNEQVDGVLVEKFWADGGYIHRGSVVLIGEFLVRADGQERRVRGELRVFPLNFEEVRAKIEERGVVDPALYSVWARWMVWKLEFDG